MEDYQNVPSDFTFKQKKIEIHKIREFFCCSNFVPFACQLIFEDAFSSASLY